VRAARAAGALALLTTGAIAPGAVAQQPAAASGVQVRVTDAGPGPSGRIIREALAAPHETRVAEGGPVDLPRDSSYATSVIVLGGDATVGGHVRGDVIVVDGDLFLHPGAEISGRAVAVGGCVYNSTLATVRGERVCFRENTFRVTRGAAGEVLLAYEPLRAIPPSRVYLAGVSGFQPPGYDRVNGLSLSWGPTVALDTGRFEIEPRITYRSDLGVVDPSLGLRAELGRRTVATVEGERGTFTNEGWIRSDLVNAVTALAFGTDARNYYRADRYEARLARAVEREVGTVALFAAARTEDARSVNPDSTSRSAPFSFFGRRDRERGMLRANPQGSEGRITSGLVGAAGSWASGDLTARTELAVELPVDAPGGARFVQAIFDAETNFATFGTHRVHAGAHAVVTGGDATPRQRYAYLGGSGTLPTETLLQFGGDELLFVDGLYSVPIERVRLPLVGSPAVGLRYAAGSAGVRTLPRFTQNVGVRLTLSLARLEFLVNPATGDANFGFGVAVLR
jgi:hypothetical protein